MPAASPTRSDRPADRSGSLAASVAAGAPPEIEHLFQVSLFLLIVTGFGAVVSTGKLDLFSIFCVLATLLLRAVLLLRDRPFAISRRLAFWLAGGYFPVALADYYFFSGRDFVTPAVHLVLFGICVKIFNVERERDYIYLALLSFLMVLSAAILTVDTAFLGAFALFTVLAVFWFMTLELRRSSLASSNTAMLVTPRWRGHRTISPLQRLAVSLVRATVVMVAAILAAGTVLFFALPRIGGGYLSRQAQSDAISVGYSDTVDLGTIGRIQQSSEVVAHIRIDGDTAGDRSIRLRGAVLSHFDGKRWTDPQHQSDILSQSSGRIFQLAAHASLLQSREDLRLAHGPQIDRLTYHVLMEPLSTSVIFTIPSAQALVGPFHEIGVDSDLTFHNLDRERTVTRYDGLSDVSVPVPTALAQLPDLPLPQQAPVMNPPATAPRLTGATNFRATSNAAPSVSAHATSGAASSTASNAASGPTPDSAPGAADNAAPFERYLQLPEHLDPRISELAHQLTADQPNDYRRANAIERYLSTRYAYTLQLPVRTPDDPVADFLFNRRRGHCEYFASSMAVMLRSAGIPSRMVTGFRGAQFNQVSTTYIVRASNAHGWVEAYIPGAGWMMFDPTPSSDSPAPTTLFGRLQLYLDAGREFWREWIVNYDTGHQQALSIAAATQTRHRTAELRHWAARQYRSLLGLARRLHRSITHNPGGLLQRIRVLLLLLLIPALPYAVFRLHSRRRAASPRLSPRSAASILYLRMTRRLARRGYSRAPAQTASEFAGSIPDPPLREAVLRFTSAYERARFGGSSEQAAQLAGLLDQVRQTLSAS